MLTPKQKRKLDRKFSKRILERDDRICQWCGKKDGKKDTAHLIPRGFIPLRYNECNAVCLCFRCHQVLWHNNPLLAVAWIRTLLGNAICDELIKIESINRKTQPI